MAARRAEGRRRLRWLLALASAVALAGAAYGLSVSPLLSVGSVTVRGTAQVGTGEITAAADVDGAAVWWLDTAEVERRIVRLVPWVGEARVERRFPRAVTITVIERTAVAWTRRDDDGIVLVDVTGRVLSTSGEAPAGLPELVDLADVGRPGRRVHPAAGGAVAAALGPLTDQVATVAVVDGAATVILASGVEVRMGEPVDLAAKAVAARAVVDDLAAEDVDVSYIDVTVAMNPVAG